MEAASSYPQVSHVNYNIFIEYIELVIKLLEKKNTHKCLTSITISSIEYIELVIKFLGKKKHPQVSHVNYVGGRNH
jgi:hypothetical protein